MKTQLNRLLVLSFWIFLAYCMAQFYNPLHITSHIYKFNKAFYCFPQGWGFFTKDPQEELVNVFKIDLNKTTRVDYSNGSFENYCGLSKKARYNLIETGTIYTKIKGSKQWKASKGEFDPVKHLQTQADTLKYDRKYENFTRGSSFIFIRYKTVPFAWSLNNQENYNPYEVIKLYIK